MYFPYLIKELTRRKFRTTTNVLTVAVIITMLIILTSIMTTYTSAIYLPFKNIDADMILQKTEKNTNDVHSEIRLPFGKGIFNENEIEKIVTLNHVQKISKAFVLWDFNKKGFISIEGLEPNSFLSKKLTSWITKGRFIKESDNKKVVLEYHFANFHHLEIDDNITIKNETFSITGILKIKEGYQISSFNIYMKLSDAQNLANIDGYSQIYVKLDELSSEKLIKSEISLINKKIVAISGDSIATSLGNIVNIYKKFYLIGLGILVLIVVLILFKINATGLLERRKDIGAMQAVGWTKKEITKQIISEIFLQTTSGFILGVLISVVIITLVGSITVQSISTGLESNLIIMRIPLVISPITIMRYFILTITVSLLVSYFLARKISVMKPSENLRSL